MRRCRGPALGVSQCPGQGQRVLASLQGLVRIAQRPEGKGRMVAAMQPRIESSIEEGQGMVSLGIVEGYPPGSFSFWT